MRPSDLDGHAAHLRDAFDELQIAWEEANEEWNDAVSRKFCEHHLEPIGPLLKQTLDAVSRMAQLSARVRRDCSE